MIINILLFYKQDKSRDRDKKARDAVEWRDSFYLAQLFEGSKAIRKNYVCRKKQSSGRLTSFTGVLPPTNHALLRFLRTVACLGHGRRE